MQVLFLEIDKTKEVKERKKCQFACFLCYIPARME